MRLIDVDKLPRHGSRGGIVLWSDIEKALTVDAIPISFIKELIELSRKVGADHHAESLEILLRDWEERKER